MQEINVTGLFMALRPETVRKASADYTRNYSVKLSDYATK